LKTRGADLGAKFRGGKLPHLKLASWATWSARPDSGRGARNTP
jgi:hypothetical protein